MFISSSLQYSSSIIVLVFSLWYRQQSTTLYNNRKSTDDKCRERQNKRFDLALPVSFWIDYQSYWHQPSNIIIYNEYKHVIHYFILCQQFCIFIIVFNNVVRTAIVKLYLKVLAKFKTFVFDSCFESLTTTTR